MTLGYPVRPAGDEKVLEPGFTHAVTSLIIYLTAKTRIGALCTTEHCRHAPREMEDLDTAFRQLRAKAAELPMPSFDRLYSQMPSWEQIRNMYLH